RGYCRLLVCPLAIVLDQRPGLLMVDRQAVTHRRLAVGVALNQFFAGDIVLANLVGWVVLDVIDTARDAMHAAPRHTLAYLFVVDGDFEHVIELDAGFLHGVGLGEGAWEAVEQETIGTIAVADALLDQGYDDVIGDQPAAGHDLVDLEAQLATLLDRCTQHV